MNKVIPITLITGFLGSGKSTLIKRIIKEKKDKKIGLILNEFGDLALESEIIDKNSDEVVELSNGCMCCIVRKDLLDSVEKLIEKNYDLDYILAEASGLSDPVPIANTFLHNDLDGKIRLDSVLCVVDSLNVRKNFSDFVTMFNQINFSDFVVVSKTDVSEKETFEAICDLINSFVPSKKIFEGKELDLDLVLDLSTLDHSDIKNLEVHDHHHDHKEHNHSLSLNQGLDLNNISFSVEKPKKEYNHVHEHVDTLFYKNSEHFDLVRFEKVMENLPKEIVRVKGFVAFHERFALSKVKCMIQYVGTRKEMYAKDWKENEIKQTALVFIGKHFDKQDLKNKLDSCVVK